MSEPATGRDALAMERSRAADFIALTKPELTFLSVLTALAGYYLGAEGAVDGVRMAAVIAGTAMVGGGSGSLNQLLERHYDARMKRTEGRPLPSGRIAPREALLFGLLLSLGGMLVLAWGAGALSASLGAVTEVTYLLLYTPLKRMTPAATLIGGIPGALPPVMGWAAASGDLTGGAWVLFGILFFWQMPHFLSLAWMYRRDYARAGYRMLAVSDPDGRRTSAQSLLHALALIPVTLLLTREGGAGVLYGVTALLLGAGFLLSALRFRLRRTSGTARSLFIASLLYLPALMLSMVVDRMLR